MYLEKVVEADQVKEKDLNEEIRHHCRTVAAGDGPRGCTGAGSHELQQCAIGCALQAGFRCTGTQIAGVGNTNADLDLAVEGTANFVCHNPGNDNIVEPHSGTVSEETSTTLTPSRNGTLVVPAQSVTISPEEAAAQFTCPNPNWREEFTGFSDLSFTYTLTFAGFTAPAISITG